MFSDERGKLIFPIKNNSNKFNECTVSINKLHVFRGIHINEFDKLVTCIQGKFLDIIINFDEASPEYLIPKYHILDPNTEFYQLLIPKNFGHCFLCLEEGSIILYHFNGNFSDQKTKHINYLDPTINISLPIDNPILSKNDKVENFIKKIEFVVFGGDGFLGSSVIKYLKAENKTYVKCGLRLQNVSEIEVYLDKFKPKNIINCAGVSGVPNIFWCDENKTDTIENNITYQLTLLKICREKNIHLTILGSGGIFKNDKFYNESDDGNFNLNFYSTARIYLENLIKPYKNVLYLRINYPICDFYSNKNLLTKLLNYETIDDVEISFTYIDDLFPKLIHMIDNCETGICNFVNSGSITLSKILEIYNENESHNYTISKKKIEPRSYSKLNINTLKKYNILNSDDAIRKCVKNYINNLKKIVHNNIK